MHDCIRWFKCKLSQYFYTVNLSRFVEYPLFSETRQSKFVMLLWIAKRSDKICAIAFSTSFCANINRTKMIFLPNWLLQANILAFKLLWWVASKYCGGTITGAHVGKGCHGGFLVIVTSGFLFPIVVVLSGVWEVTETHHHFFPMSQNTTNT